VALDSSSIWRDAAGLAYAPRDPASSQSGSCRDDDDQCGNHCGIVIVLASAGDLSRGFGSNSSVDRHPAQRGAGRQCCR